jgi:hypothetical protein
MAKSKVRLRQGAWRPQTLAEHAVFIQDFNTNGYQYAAADQLGIAF